MICIAWVTVFQVNDSAAGEAVFLQDVVHDAVVGVCVDADDMDAFLSDLLKGPVKHCPGSISAWC